MTPRQKIKWLILAQAAMLNNEPAPEYPSENIDDLYIENEDLYDAEYEVRRGGVETGLKTESSRYYEARAHAAQLPDSSWVGWTYWYGGGKYGEPESMQWMENAYDVDCVEEIRVVNVFSKKA